MRKKVFSKRIAACTLAFALAFQPIAAIPGTPMAVVEAAEEDGYEFATGRYVSYKNDTLTFKAVDSGITFAQVFYKVFDTEEAAKAMTNIDGLPSNDMTDADADGTWEVSKTEADLEGKYIAFFCNTIIDGVGTPMAITVYQIPGGVEDASSETSEGGSSEEGGNQGGEQEAVAISEFAYFDDSNGKAQSYKANDNCFSFCYPLMNGSAITSDGLEAMEAGFDILVKRNNGDWENIETALTYDTEWEKSYWTWGEGTDWAGGSWGLMIKLTESMEVRFQSTSNVDVYLDYSLVYTEPEEPVEITSIELDYAGGQIDADGTGTVLLDFANVKINGGDVSYADADASKLITWTAKYESGAAFAALDSVFTWNQNMFWDAGSAGIGAWVLQGIKEPLTVRVSSVANPAIYGEVLVYVDTTVDEKGDEYDFSDTENNAKYDAVDPGTTKEGYDLIWADEFNGDYGEDANVDAETGLNLDNWTPQDGDGTVYGNPGWGNAELQAYTGRTENVGVNEDINDDGIDDGVLRITAAYEETPYVYGAESAKDYTSARLHSTKMNEELFNTTYGYVEARMSLPMTTGAWPAFWMLPQSGDIYGGWPVSGEIDIMETTGLRTNEACGTLHRGTPGQIYSGSGYVQLDSNINYFHTYAIDWEPGKITWYYDGEKIHEETNWESAFSGASSSLAYDAPFDAPFYVLLNLAVDSGRFGGTANAASFQDDINMYVDYVRVYQKEDGYADSVVREAANSGDDWADYAGINQIGTITSDSLVDSEGQLYAMETSGTVDASKWYLACTEGGAATVEPYTADGKDWAKVNVTAAGGQDYSAQLIGHYDAKAGYVYKISFDAYAAGDMVGETVSLTSTEWAGWGKYGRKQFTLSDTPQSEVFYMEQTASFDNCRIEFNLGAVATGDVYISNVKVEIVDPASLGTEGGNRKPLSDGNVIYNGSFNEGNHRLGYWKAGADTDVSVPRYTTKDLTGSDVSVVDVASTLNGFEPEAAENGGKKYYERRAQISAEAGTTPSIYQAGIPLKADTYTLNFEMYSEEDTSVTAAIYTANAEGKLVTKVLESAVVNYTAGSGVKNYSWTFTTPAVLENAAVVLTFADGVSVQIDDVSMLGATQAEEIDETPVDADSTWNANGGGSGSVAADGYSVVDGVHTVTGATSGNEWYSPQITSSTFTVASGTTYQISAKLKLEGTNNGVVSYMVQEQNGSWTVVKDVEDITLADLEKDADGFYIYETTFVCDKAVSNVALNWGLGKSGADNATFIFKDVTMTVAQSGGNEGPGGDPMGGETPAEFANITYVLGEGAVNAEENPAFVTKAEGTMTLAAPTREGYIFLGWTTEEDSTEYITEISTNADITVYAQWEERVDAATPVITKDLEDVTCAPNADVTLKVEAEVEDGGELSYQWYVSLTPTGAGEAIDGATSATYKPDTTTNGQKYYYCVVTNTNEDVKGETEVSTKSSVVAVSVNGSTVAPEEPGSSQEPGSSTQPTTSTQQPTTSTQQPTTSTQEPTTEAKVELKAIKVTLDSKNIAAGKSVKLKVASATAGAEIDKVTYSVNKSKYAKVSKSGKVTTKKAGKGKKVKVTVKATGVDGGTATKTITINIKKHKVTKVTIKNGSKINVKYSKKSVKLKATVKTNGKSAYKKLKWTSSNTKYATVDKNGKVKFKAAGKGKTVKITAKALDGTGKKDTIRIKIKK